MLQPDNNPSTTAADVYDCIIVGGGLSGVAFAWYLRTVPAQRILILEQSPRIGGQIHTIRPASHPDYQAEAGAHTCYHSYTTLLAAAEEAGLADDIRSAGRLSYRMVDDAGRHCSFFSRLNIVRLAFGAVGMMRAGREGKTVRHYFRPHVGAGNYDRLFSRMFRAVICQPPDDYPARFFLKRRKEKRKDLSPRVVFKGGLSSLTDTLAARSGAEIATGIEVTSIQADGNGYRLSTQSGATFAARRVALAVDPQTAARLSATIDPAVSALLRSVATVRVDSLCLIIPKSQLTLPAVAGLIPLTDGPLMSAVAGDSSPHPDVRSFTLHFAPGHPRHEQLAIARRTLGLPADATVEAHFTTHLLPAPRLADVDLADRLDALRTATGVYYTGNYYYGLSLEDCVRRSAREAGRAEVEVERLDTQKQTR